MTVLPNSNINSLDEDDGIHPNQSLCSKEYISMTGGRRCKCLVCKPGYQPHICNTGDPDTSFCEPCPKGQYQQDRSVLGRDGYCQYWRKCDQPHMTVQSQGGPTYDVQCGCSNGTILSESGRHCEHVPQNPSADKNTISDTKPTSIPHIKDVSHAGSTSVAQNNAWKVILPVTIIGVLLILVIIAVIYYRRKKERQARTPMVVNERVKLLEKNISDIEDADLHEKVMTVCGREIELKIGRDWKKLGRHLLGDRLDYALESTRDSSIEEKTCEILKTWHQQLGHRATMKILLDALKAIRRQDVIDHLCQVIHRHPELGMHFRQDENDMV